MLTIFTPVYNRADYIERVYQSLKRQTNQNFEWIIINDGSTDATEEVVRSFFKEKKDFTITYINQVHGGKHRAINQAVKIAKGEYFFIVDSDDYLLPNAAEMLCQWIQEIDSEIAFAGVAGLKVYSDGRIIGGKPNIKLHSYVDCTILESYKYKLVGDKAEAYRTTILKDYPFPEYEGEYFIAEGVVWNKIACDGYKVRWYNEPLQVAEYLQDGLTKTNNIQRVIDNFQGYCETLKISMKYYRWFEKMNAFFVFNRAAHKKEISLYKRGKYIAMNQNRFYILYFIGLPIFLPYKIFHRLFAKWRK